ncbi:histidinol-phosphate transaminase [Amycolatopsis sp. NPDC021455]|uniref:pyridoxal phosphate-dependent aminotransferase n=1 Tax=Amycolatopsis sp. NPDC021455 TaxID=3154901 RepID=UPI0033D758C7
MTTSGLFQQDKAHSPSFFSVARAMGQHADDLADFCIPCNPYFPTDEMFGELERGLRTILKFYPSDAGAITAQLASVLRLNPSTISLANGSTELITWIDQLLVGSSVAVPIPTFGRWTDQPMETGKRVDMFLLKEADGFELRVDEYIDFIKRRGSRVAVLCNPNNPDGGYLPRREVLRFMDALEDLDLVVIDESFVDFVEVERNPSVAAEAVVRPNVIVLKSLGKNFGLHGIRFGYQVSNPALTRKLSAALPKWNLNSLAEAVIFMLAEHRAEYEDSLKKLALDRFMMSSQLAQFPELTVYPSQANFLLVKLPGSVDGAELCDHLLAEHHLLVRQCGNKIGMTSQFIRLGVRPDTEVERLVEGLCGVERLGGGRHTTPAFALVSHAREPERSIS